MKIYEVIQNDTIDILYHGTCSTNASALIKNGWSPNMVGQGGNMGQPRYLYLTSFKEDALWFAEEKGCSTVIGIKNIPITHLRVDPEDGIGDDVFDELNNKFGLPGKVILIKPLNASYFELVSGE